MILASVRPAAAGAVRVPYLAAAFPEYWAGRLPQLYFRGLFKLHSRYGLPGCCNLKVYICPQGFTKEVSLPQCLGSYRDEPTISRTGLSPAGNLRPRGAPICGGWPILRTSGSIKDLLAKSCTSLDPIYTNFQPLVNRKTWRCLTQGYICYSI